MQEMDEFRRKLKYYQYYIDEWFIGSSYIKAKGFDDQHYVNLLIVQHNTQWLATCYKHGITDNLIQPTLYLDHSAHLIYNPK
jgi:hypothetical protein